MRTHKSILAWQEAREVASASIRFARDYWRPHGSALFDQLQRSALSVVLNIAEGYAFGPGARFNDHLRIAYGSAVETADLLELGMHEQLIPTEQGTPVLARCHRSQALIMGLRKRRPTT